MGTFSPRTVSVKSGKAFADLSAVGYDLDSTKLVVQEMLNDVGKPLVQRYADALLDSGFIRYRRCFTSGKRDAICPESIASEFRPLHDKLWLLGNKHIAHSASDYEVNNVMILMGPDEPERRGFAGIMQIQKKLNGLTTEELTQWIALIESLKVLLKDFLEKAKLNIYREVLEKYSLDQMYATPAFGHVDGKVDDFFDSVSGRFLQTANLSFF